MRRSFGDMFDNLGRNIDRVFERADALLDEVFSQVELDVESTPPGNRHHVKAGKEKVEIYIEVPGLSPEQVAVRLEGNLLVVEAKAADLVPGRKFEMLRRFRVNPHVRSEHITASVKNGLLTIIVTPPPKPPKTEGTTIPVSPG